MRQKDNRILNLTLITIVSTIVVWGLFQFFFDITSLGYVEIGDSYCKCGPIPAKYASFTVGFKSKYTGRLTLIDKSGKQLSNSDYTVLMNGKEVGTCFNAPGKHLIKISIRGNSSRVNGRNFVRVEGGGPFVSYYYFRHHANPFVYYIICLLTAIVFALILWYVFLQKQFFPLFKAINKTIIIPNQAPIIISFKGYREVVISPNIGTQSLLDKWIKGPILYKVSPAMTSPIKLKPAGKGQDIIVAANPTHYICNPNPIKGFAPAKIINRANEQIININ